MGEPTASVVSGEEGIDRVLPLADHLIAVQPEGRGRPVNADLPTPAGFTDVALVQAGDEGREQFLAEAAEPLLDKLRADAP